MKKFEEEFDKNVDVVEIQLYESETVIKSCNPNQVKALGHGWVSPEDHQAEIDKLKSQIEKQEPEIPQFVARVVESNDLEMLTSWDNIFPLLSEQMKSWLLGSELVKGSYTYLLADLKINGYKVAKEKKYLLKHKSLVIYDGEGKEADVDELYLNAEGNFTIYSYNAKIFTQSEIDRMSTDSYELIEVEK